jgi:hypothetical protein
MPPGLVFGSDKKAQTSSGGFRIVALLSMVISGIREQSMLREVGSTS